MLKFLKKKWKGVHLSGEERAEVSIVVQEDVKAGTLYWLEIFLSSAIATFGILQNSVAVIIGAMLIAPLMRPIQGVAFAIITGRAKFFWNSSKLLIKSILLSIIIAYISSRLVPLKIETSEFLARTSPNLIDLFIAVFSAVLAFLVFSYKRLSSSIAGVAMAASLMPPLAVVGISLSLGKLQFAWGSLFLFLTNLLAILLVGIVIFAAYGFTPHQEMDKVRTFNRLSLLLVSLIAFVFPLTSSLFNLVDMINVKQQAKLRAEAILLEDIPEAHLSVVDILESDREKVSVRFTVELPEESIFFDETRESLLASLEDDYARDVDLDITLVRVAKAVSTEVYLSAEEATRKTAYEEDMEKEIKEIFLTGYPESDLIRLEVFLSTDDFPRRHVKMIFSSEDVLFPEDIQRNIEREIRKRFAAERFVFNWRHLSTAVKKAGEENKYEELVKDILIQHIENFIPNSFIKKEEVLVSQKRDEDDDKSYVFDIIVHVDENFDKENFDWHPRSLAIKLGVETIDAEFRFVPYQFVGHAFEL